MDLIREHLLVPLLREVDIFVARELAAEMVGAAGFDPYQCADIETAVSELCSNALKYGKQGWAMLRIGPDVFEAVVTDEGPGFEAAPGAKTGLGVGLAGAGRLMDGLEIERMALGSRVTIKKRRPGADPSRVPHVDWEITVVNRLRTGRSVSGDGWWARPLPSMLLAAVVDGLGSGVAAAAATKAIITGIADQDPTAPLERLLGSAHQAARDTRGGVGVITRIEGDMLEYCGVGDVGGRIEPSGDTFLVQAGILGVEIPDPVVRRLPWPQGSHLALWTDGLRLPADSVSGLAPDDDDHMDQLVLDHGTERDDALLLLASRRGEAGGS